jgi:hypothetical protein
LWKCCWCGAPGWLGEGVKSAKPQAAISEYMYMLWHEDSRWRGEYKPSFLAALLVGDYGWGLWLEAGGRGGEHWVLGTGTQDEVWGTEC